MRIYGARAIVLSLMSAAVLATAGDTGAGQAPAPTPAACLPAGGLQVADTIRRALDDGSEVTEPLGPGAYRVTRCDDENHPRVTMTVLPLSDPDRGSVGVPAIVVRRGVIRSFDYGDVAEPTWVAEWRRARATVLASVIRATPGSPRRDPNFRGRRATATAAASSACDDGGHEQNPGRWPDGRYSWKWNASSFGGNAATRDALQQGHEAWNKTLTDCSGIKDDTAMAAKYDGSTSRHAGEADGVNVVDRGKLTEDGCEGAIACTWTWWNSDSSYVETDTRFSSAVDWSNSGKTGYDYRGVATHEFGHAIGLADLEDSPNLTMAFATGTRNTAQRTLGRGDVLGLRSLYGG